MRSINRNRGSNNWTAACGSEKTRQRPRQQLTRASDHLSPERQSLSHWILESLILTCGENAGRCGEMKQKARAYAVRTGFLPSVTEGLALPRRRFRNRLQLADEGNVVLAGLLARLLEARPEVVHQAHVVLQRLGPDLQRLPRPLDGSSDHLLGRRHPVLRELAPHGDLLLHDRIYGPGRVGEAAAQLLRVLHALPRTRRPQLEGVLQEPLALILGEGDPFERHGDAVGHQLLEWNAERRNLSNLSH